MQSQGPLTVTASSKHTKPCLQAGIRLFIQLFAYSLCFSPNWISPLQLMDQLYPLFSVQSSQVFLK